MRGSPNTRPSNFALGIEVVDVDRVVTNPIVERRQVAHQFQRARRTHCVANKTFCVVHQHVARIAKDAPQGGTLLDIAAGGGGGVRADDVDIPEGFSRARS